MFSTTFNFSDIVIPYHKVKLTIPSQFRDTHSQQGFIQGGVNPKSPLTGGQNCTEQNLASVLAVK
jgi:hypothetical protein